jgi:putative copper resistance protein D
MALLAGFLDVILRGIGLIALCAAVGGLAYAVVVLRVLVTEPPPPAWTTDAGRRLLGLVALGAVVLAVSRGVVLLVLHPWVLADAAGRWPVGEFAATSFGQASLVGIALAVALAVAAGWLRARPQHRGGWLLALAIGLAILLNSAWLAHAVSRLQDRTALMAGTVLHQAGAVLWLGGLMHLARSWRAPLPPAALARFSMMAMVGVGFIVAPGIGLTLGYVGDWRALVGTGYGVMVLTKVTLMGSVLVLGGLNYLLIRRVIRAAGAGATPARVRPLVEAEVGIGITILFAAASLTSLPPAVDVVADRASPAEVASRFVPKMPRLSSPPVDALLAAAAPIDDTLSTRQPEEYAWSEYNHHMAGLFVFSMGLLALLERTGRARWARHWPLLLLGLAAFMFVRNDPRAWPLGPAGFWESMALPDVLQHRLVVLLVVGLGLFEWLVRIGALARPGWRLVFPVLCAVGGGLLLTHSHAMFNLKSEFLAEVSHAPMGVLGVFMGWGRWLELRLPRGEGVLPGWVWAASLVLIGGILLFYRET